MFCPKCGIQNDDNSKFCQGCGATLTEPAAPDTSAAPPPPSPAYNAPPPVYQQTPAPKAKKSHAGVIIAVILVLILVVCAVIFVPKMFSDKDESTTAAATTETTAAQTTAAVSEQETTAAIEGTTQTASQPSEEEIRNALSGLGITDWDGNWSSLTDAQKQALEDYYAGLGQDVQFTDGGIVVKDGDETVQLGGKWPDSPLMKDVPKADFGKVFSTSVKTNEVTILLSNITEANCTEYIGKVKDAGFNKNPEEFNMYGTLSYDADNSSGLHINVAMAMGYFTITVSTGS